MILVRTHGGLGNQLFQIGRAMLLQARVGQPIARIHDVRYKVAFSASPLFADLDRPVSAVLQAASWVRLPKLLSLAGRASEIVVFGHAHFLDGYFQTEAEWRGDVASVLRNFRARLGVVPGCGKGVLAHLRLGDFFVDEATQRDHLYQRLAGLSEGTTIISNRDDLLAENEIFLVERGLRHWKTGGLSPENILQMMAGFAEIQSNDSTLAIWASLLGGASMQPKDSRLAALHATIRAADA